MSTTSEVKDIQEKGTISVQMENIFPIIKKAIYNDKEIFLRELISNGIDAIQKLRHLMVIGKAEKTDDEFKIQLNLDKEARTLSIIDNGIGMTADEIKKYINQVAFSSATEFMEKYQSGDKNKQIIGHFGLGFYSSFMVAEKVEIHTRSYQEGAEAIVWSCDGSPQFEITPGERTERGTEIKLFLTEDEVEFAEEARIQHLVKKYCDFLPFPIMIGDKQANKQEPLWNKNPNDVTKEEYLEFYQYLYPFSPEPYLWVHLNVEVPFRLKGILYFPKLTHELDPSKGNIKLFCNNVYVSDHVEDFIPRFLITLKGAIDCPEIPLNVSRSMLQNDPYVARVSNFITKKVADKLKQMYNTDKEHFVKSWEDIHTFIKVGMMEDDKFYDKVKDIVIFKSSKDGEYVTLQEYLTRNPETDNKVYYTSDEIGQSSYLEMFKAQGTEVLYMNTLIDTHFIQFLEFKNNEVKFARIDSDISDSLVEKDKAKIVDPKTNKTSDEMVEELFVGELNKLPKLKVKVEALKSEDIPALVLLPENARRFQEMSMFMSQGAEPDNDLMLDEHTLVVNSNHPTIQNLKGLSTGDKKENLSLICEHIYELAMMAHRPLKGKKLEQFLANSNKVLQIMSSKI